MKSKDIEKLAKVYGTFNSALLITIFQEFNIEEIVVHADGLSIPVPATLGTLDAFQGKFISLRAVGRFFPYRIEGECIHIGVPSRGTYVERSELYSRRQGGYLGIPTEKIVLPPLRPSTKILSVGAGTGELEGKVRDALGCDVHALEPGFVRDTDYDRCVERLGVEHVRRRYMMH